MHAGTADGIVSMTDDVLRADQATRMARVRLALEGLSVGDAFGSQFFIPGAYHKHFTARTTPDGEWGYTDDTKMALGIVEVLQRRGGIDAYDLPQSFPRRHPANPYHASRPLAPPSPPPTRAAPPA